jgi:Ca2+-binding RTX toxin-like protein
MAIWDGIWDGVTGAWKAVVNVASFPFKTLGELTEFLTDKVGDGFRLVLGDTIGGGIDKFLDKTGQVVNGAIQREIDYVANLPANAGRLASSIFDERLWKDFGGWAVENLLNAAEVSGLAKDLENLAEIVKINTRPLTNREKALARSVFGNSINLDIVRIDEWSLSNLVNGKRPFVTLNTINTWGNLEDAVLIHELTHVWQYQKLGVTYILDAALAQGSPGFQGGKYPDGIGAGANGYRYGGYTTLEKFMDDGKKLSDFQFDASITGPSSVVRENYEQQAKIIEDYYRIRSDSNSENDKYLAIYAYFSSQVSTLSLSELMPGNYTFSFGDNEENSIQPLTKSDFAKNDTIVGFAGNDTIDGGIGDDRMYGGLGDDKYFVDSPGDVVVEYENRGKDRVYSSITYNFESSTDAGLDKDNQFGANLEELILIFDSPINATGNAQDNYIVGNASQNQLDGRAGNDEIRGGGGDDILIGGTGADILIGEDGIDTASYAKSDKSVAVNLTTGDNRSGEAEGDILQSVENLEGSENNDLLVGDAVNNELTGSGGDDNLSGKAGNDILRGGLGDDSLSGDDGSDTLIGGSGNDNYYINDPFDLLVENINDGTDTVYSSITYTLGDNLEDMTLTGNEAISGRGNSLANTIMGNLANNSLYGEDGNDKLEGQAGDDILDGGSGVDQLSGGIGNDQYYVDNIDDDVIELSEQYSDQDIVHSSVSYTLGRYLENLTLLDIASINGTGNNQNNVITGNNASNILNGKAGNDIIHGNGGFDTILGDEGNDILNGGLDPDILNGGNGTDTASYLTALSEIVANLSNSSANTGEAQGDTYISIENLTGSQFSDILTGDTQSNSLWGLDGNDILDGLQGADSMVGGLGNDTYSLENIGDITIEGLNEGIDTVNAFIDCTLAANLDNLILIEGSSAINGIGNDLNNMIIGNSQTNTINGGAGDDMIYGGLGRDILTGGLGNDRFMFKTIRETAHTITDFTIGNDQLVLTDLMRDMGYRGSNAIGEGYISAIQSNAGLTTLQVDADGRTGTTYRLVPYAFLPNVSATALLSNPNSFIF